VRFAGYFLESTKSGILKSFLIRPLVYPSGKPMMPHLLRCQGFGVDYYSLNLDALDLQDPRLLQR
jgi:hypothetical protein